MGNLWFSAVVQVLNYEFIIVIKTYQNSEGFCLCVSAEVGVGIFCMYLNMVKGWQISVIKSDLDQSWSFWVTKFQT